MEEEGEKKPTIVADNNLDRKLELTASSVNLI